MTLSETGERLIQAFETCHLEAYLDERRIWTIGWGHTGPEVHAGLTWPQSLADRVFFSDVGYACHAIDRLGLPTLNQNQYDALASLAFNIGASAFAGSTLVRLLRAGDFVGAAAQFLVWNHINGAVNDGLTRRRKAEQALFIQPVTQN